MRASIPRPVLIGVLGAMLFARPALSQDATAPTDNPDSTATPAAAKTPAVPSHLRSWVSDRSPHAVGDLLTVVVDEQTAAREHVSKVATGNRGTDMKFNANINSGSGNPTNMAAAITSQNNNTSNDTGDAAHTGDLTAVLSVRVVAMEPGGLLRVGGNKKVTVDGRTTLISLTGVVRPEDISSDNQVLSQRIAETVITFKGKTIGPRTGIMGSLLGMLWP
jgi:flagellar L-ring protein precursor FlgH